MKTVFGCHKETHHPWQFKTSAKFYTTTNMKVMLVIWFHWAVLTVDKKTNTISRSIFTLFYQYAHSNSGTKRKKNKQFTIHRNKCRVL